jgi:hypothetical protein
MIVMKHQSCCTAQVGAQVMLLKNLDLEAGAGRMLVNGSRGVVIGFRPRVEVRDCDAKFTCNQQPSVWNLLHPPAKCSCKQVWLLLHQVEKELQDQMLESRGGIGAGNPGSGGTAPDAKPSADAAVLNFGSQPAAARPAFWAGAGGSGAGARGSGGSLGAAAVKEAKRTEDLEKQLDCMRRCVCKALVA